jgi:hypothetical protein
MTREIAGSECARRCKRRLAQEAGTNPKGRAGGVRRTGGRMTSRTGGCTPPQPLGQLLAMKRSGAAGGKSARGEPSDGPPLN